MIRPAKAFHGTTRIAGWLSGYSTVFLGLITAASYDAASKESNYADYLDMVVRDGEYIRITDGTYGTTWAGGFSDDVIVSTKLGEVEKNFEFDYPSCLPDNPTGMTSEQVLTYASDGLRESAASNLEMAQVTGEILPVALAIWAGFTAINLTTNKIRYGRFVPDPGFAYY